MLSQFWRLGIRVPAGPCFFLQRLAGRILPDSCGTSWLPAVLSILWVVVVTTPKSASAVTWLPSFNLCLCPDSLFLLEHQSLDQGPPPPPATSSTTSSCLYLERPYFQMKSDLQGLSEYEWREKGRRTSQPGVGGRNLVEFCHSSEHLGGLHLSTSTFQPEAEQS